MKKFRNRFKRYRKRHVRKGLVRAVKSIMSAVSEKKVSDTVFAAVAVTTAGVITCCSNMIQGLDDASNRIGDQIEGVSLESRLLMDGTTVAAPGVATVRPLVRLILFVDTQQNGSPPSTNGASDGILQYATITSPYKDQNIGRYHVLYDRTLEGTSIHVANQTYTAGVQTATNIEYSTPMMIKHSRIGPRYKKIKYLNANNVNNSAGKNNIYLLFLTNDTTYSPYVTGYVRLTFTDS